MKPIALALLMVTAAVSPHPAAAQDSLAFASLAAGWFHACGLTKEGRAYCWGWNPAGALGSADTVDSATPVAVAGGLTFTGLSAGLVHTCGVASGGAAYCWGDNEYRALGAATTARCSRFEDAPCTWTPLAVSGGVAFSSIAAGLMHTCALTTSGTVYCWGRNDLGQLGRGDTLDTGATPAPVVGDVRLVSLTVGGFHSCGLTAEGAAYCWGWNSVGQLGRGPDTTRGLTPAPVAGDLRFVALVAGRVHTCGATPAGAVFCWGGNAEGQLGAPSEGQCPNMRGRSACRTDPAPVTGRLVGTALSAGAGHTCALTAEGRAQCWGANQHGQLGDGTATGGQEVRAVGTDLTFAAITAGGEHTCGLTPGGTTYCWGRNHNGQLGAATATDSGLPGRIAPATATATRQPPIVIPGATIADSVLKRDTREYILTVGAVLAGVSCPHGRVTNTEIMQQPRRVRMREGRMVRGEWVERWTTNLCGKTVAFRVGYSATPNGGVTFSVQPE